MPMNKQYEENGYVVFKNFFEQAEIRRLREVILKFHQS